MGKSSVSDLSEHVFDLIQELFAIDPMLLTSVMPQLEFKLKVLMEHRPGKLSQSQNRAKHLQKREKTTETFGLFHAQIEWSTW